MNIEDLTNSRPRDKSSFTSAILISGSGSSETRKVLFRNKRDLKIQISPATNKGVGVYKLTFQFCDGFLSIPRSRKVFLRDDLRVEIHGQVDEKIVVLSMNPDLGNIDMTLVSVGHTRPTFLTIHDRRQNGSMLL